MLAGAGAGLASAVLMCPLDLIKTKLQAQAGHGKGIAGEWILYLTPSEGARKGAEGSVSPNRVLMIICCPSPSRHFQNNLDDTWFQRTV